MLTIAVDWGHNARFDHPLADLTTYTLVAEWTIGHPAPADDLPPDGRLRVTLNNADRRFSPDYPASPLYGYLLPGRRVRVVYDGVLLWSGWLDRIDVATGRYGPRTATLIALGGLSLLEQVRPDLPPQMDQTADAVIAAALDRTILNPNAATIFQLDAVAFAELDSSAILFLPSEHLDATLAKSTLRYVGDTWSARTTTRDVIEEMTAAEGGSCWQGRDGVLVFRDRHAFLTAAAPPTVELDSAAIAAIHQPTDGWYSVAEVTCYPRTLSEAPTVVWQTAAPIQIGGNSERVLTVSVDGIQSGVLALEPLAVGSDVVALDGLNRNLSAYITAAADLVGGGLARITIRNIYPAVLWLTITLRGMVIANSGAVTLEATDAVRLMALGRRVRPFWLPVADSIEAAQQFAQWRLWRDRTPPPGLTHITLVDRDTTWLANMLAWTIGTELALGEHQIGATHRYRIIGEAWTYDPAVGMRVVYTLLPADDNAYLITDAGMMDAAAVGY